MPILLLGDIVVFSLLAILLIRLRRMAEAARLTGEVDRQLLLQRKVRLYRMIIRLSLALTVIPHLLWVIAPYTLPGWVFYYTPLPLLMGVMIWTPFIVWLTPLAALVVELMIRSPKNLTR